MGGGCSCDRNPNNVSDPTYNVVRNEIENSLADFLNLDHPLNVNRKYKDEFSILSIFSFSPLLEFLRK